MHNKAYEDIRSIQSDILAVLFPSEAEMRDLPLRNTPSRTDPAALLFSFPDDALSDASFFVYGTSM
jgi:hypothetical protein